VKLCIGNLKFGEKEFGEMKRNTSNWSNFCILLRRAGLSALAGLCCYNIISELIIFGTHKLETFKHHTEFLNISTKCFLLTNIRSFYGTVHATPLHGV